MKKFITLLYDTFKLALQSIFAHKLRAFLTLIGIIIGVASVVLVGASISGLNAYITETVSKVLGSNHFLMSRIVTNGPVSDEEWERMDRRNKQLHEEDYDWLQKYCTDCSDVGMQVSKSTDLRHEGKELLGTIVNGISASMLEIGDKDIVEGRFILPHEVEHSATVCVIGTDVRDKFFTNIDPIGKVLNINGLPMQVIGIEGKRGSLLGRSMDNNIYIPFTSFEHIFGHQQNIQLHGKAGTKEIFPAAIEEARVAMRNRHKLKGNDDDDFGLVNVDQVNNRVDQFTDGIALVTVPITLISLVVGGIVVMNIMLVSVTERTFEIGLRKALGANRRQILLQFLMESSLLSAMGGILGLLVAAGLSMLITKATEVPMHITIPYVLMSVIVSGGIGMVAGIYPAYKAAKLDPIIALTKN